MPSDPDLFDGIYARGDAAAELTGRAWLQAMLDFEAALARAHAAAGRIPAAHAARIAAVCDAGEYDLAALAREGSRHAGPVVGLIAELRLRAGVPAGDSVHLGATSQDTIDTAAGAGHPPGALPAARRRRRRGPRGRRPGARARRHRDGRADPAAAGPARLLRSRRRRLGVGDRRGVGPPGSRRRP